MINRITPSDAAGAPFEIVRLGEVRRYIPVGRTRRDELIAAGLLEVVSLTPPTRDKHGVTHPGRAKGITLRSIRKYQTLVMGLGEASDDAK
jgi:hypothetical protein